MCDVSGSRSRPLAVGVLALHPSDAAQRSAARVKLTLDAYRLGYLLLDTVEITPAGTGYLAAELLIARTGAGAVVVRGPVDRDWLHAVADRHGLDVRDGQV